MLTLADFFCGAGGSSTGAAQVPDVQYVLLGNRREQVKQAGNAVTPPAARDLVAAVVDTLGAAA